MEEKALTGGQETTTENEKMSYDDLMNVAVQLQQQNQQLQNQLRQSMLVEKRLYYLFEVIKYADLFGDFATECVNEVKELLDIPEQEEKKSEQDPKKDKKEVK